MDLAARIQIFKCPLNSFVEVSGVLNDLRILPIVMFAVFPNQVNHFLHFSHCLVALPVKMVLM